MRSFGTHIFLFCYFCNCIYVSTWTKPFFQAYVPRRWDTRKNDRCGKTMDWIKNTGYYESRRMPSDIYTNTTGISPHSHPLTWFIDFWTRTIWESERRLIVFRALNMWPLSFGEMLGSLFFQSVHVLLQSSVRRRGRAHYLSAFPQTRTGLFSFKCSRLILNLALATRGQNWPRQYPWGWVKAPCELPHA